jgi:hypothetical protein
MDCGDATVSAYQRALTAKLRRFAKKAQGVLAENVIRAG